METIAPVPFPDAPRLGPPDDAEVDLIVGAYHGALATETGLTQVQQAVIDALTHSMTGRTVDVASAAPVGARELAEGLARRDHRFRTRIFQTILLAELLLVPLPPDVSARVETYAAWLGVCDDMQRVARDVARGSLGLALVDFRRSGYFEHLLATPPEHLHASDALEDAWQFACHDTALAARWADLEHCPDGSLGQGVWRFYRARGFTFPGLPQSAPPTLAQHDWVHVLADYGSTVECEIEVFGFIARANDDPRAFSLLAMVLGLFETGYLHDAANLFEYDRGHLSRDAQRMATRLADAMYRGAMVGTHLDASGRSADTDLLTIDWFAHAARPIDDVRADFGVRPKSLDAIEAGSVTPWERGGISPFQVRAGRAAAEADGRVYHAYGASPG